MSSSEDDYMSDAFLTGCVKEDIRPGLIRSHSDKRSHEMLKKKRDKDETNKTKNPPKSTESETREMALNQPIPVDNKGYAMLQKLGFQPGSGLGKLNAGRVEPVPIKLKTDRQGLGRVEALKELATMKEMKAKLRKEIHSKLMNVEDYRSHLAEKTAERRALIDLKKSQRICKHFDTNSGVEEPEEPWYWPDYERNESDNKCDVSFDEDNGCDDGQPSCISVNEEDEEDEGADVKEEEEEEEEEEYTVKDKLEMLTYYLRNVYYYCIWCGVEYDDDRDLQKECPGPTYGDH